MNTPMQCLITGGSGLIGTAIAHRFLAEGYQVHLVDLKKPNKDLNAQVNFYQIDVGSEEDVTKLYHWSKLRHRWGHDSQDDLC